MSDLVSRLRGPHVNPLRMVDGTEIDRLRGLCLEAADEIERLQAAKRRALAIADERAKEAVALRAALERLTKDPPATLAREPDTDAEVIIKMRAIARAALSGKDPA